MVFQTLRFFSERILTAISKAHIIKIPAGDFYFGCPLHLISLHNGFELYVLPFCPSKRPTEWRSEGYSAQNLLTELWLGGTVRQ